MGKTENIAAQVRFGEAVNSGKLEDLRNLIAPGAVDHDPSPDQGVGPEGFIRMFTAYRAAFPDLKVSVDKLVADDDNISFAYTMAGTHQGDFMGIPASGKKFSAHGLQISRFENGKLVERWGSSDQLGILQQLGVLAKAAGK
jgi:steroid delta-isomerase-like uncharacterized protein